VTRARLTGARPRRSRRWLRALLRRGNGGGLWGPFPGGWTDPGDGAGVREPRRPLPTLPAMSVARPEPWELSH